MAVLGTAVSVTAAWLVLRWLAARVEVSGPSMAPTLLDGDRVLVNRLAMRIRPPRPGEIVVARVASVPGELTIKRVARKPLSDGSLRAPACRTIVDDEPRLGRSPRRASGERFVLLGDNPALSTDSRAFGAVPRHCIDGVVWYRYFPPNRHERIR